ncbi:Rv0909 family putative TA system antitoxin [Nonomuraea sp. NPDC003560]|uniref:Rv0909 family putative TA system antitoxin n=1 Tax=unclassified Nonomuraea TaxID=2593643 RepID=UPI003421B9E1
MGISDWLKKAEDLAKEHPAETAEVLRRAEEFVEDDTGHQYDQQIKKGLEAVEEAFGGEGEENQP